MNAKKILAKYPFFCSLCKKESHGTLWDFYCKDCKKLVEENGYSEAREVIAKEKEEE